MTTAACAQLELHDARVCFGAKTALDGVHLRIERGERVAVIGANGSGKSTLLRAVHGLLPLAGGRRSVGTRAGGRPLRQAMVFQRPFMLRLSARANIELGLWFARVPRAERRARCDDALRRVGLVADAQRNARALSAGQQQRLALARAWALEPDLLLLDEPTASLDPTAKREVEALIDTLGATGVTVLFASHNLGQVKRLATRVVCLDAGRVAADLPTAALFGGAAPRDVERFLRAELAWQ